MLIFCWLLDEENILYFVVMLSPQVGPDNNDIIVCLPGNDFNWWAGPGIITRVSAVIIITPAIILLLFRIETSVSVKY